MVREKKQKSRLSESGFSLLELMAVIVLAAAFSYSVLISIDAFDQSGVKTRQLIISAIQDARVLSITHDISEGEVILIISTDGVDLRLSDKSYMGTTKNYPIDFPSSISLEGREVSLSFNRFGETQEKTLGFSTRNQQHILIIEQTGYAYWLDE